MIKYCKNNFLKLSIIILIFTHYTSKAQIKELNLGLKFQKSYELYYENGFGVEFGLDSSISEQLTIGASYLSSRLGSAINSNAIKQDQYLFSTSYYFYKDDKFQPLTRLNIGYILADFGSKKFDEIDNSMMLLSLEGGVAYKFDFPLKTTATVGLNLNTSDGLSGLGTVFPLFFQINIFWDLYK